MRHCTRTWALRLIETKVHRNNDRVSDKEQHDPTLTIHKTPAAWVFDLMGIANTLGDLGTGIDDIVCHQDPLPDPVVGPHCRHAGVITRSRAALAQRNLHVSARAEYRPPLARSKRAQHSDSVTLMPLRQNPSQ